MALVHLLYRCPECGHDPMDGEGDRARCLSNIPRHGPFFLVANHQSTLDPLMVQGHCPRRVHFFAKSTQFAASRAFHWLLTQRSRDSSPEVQRRHARWTRRPGRVRVSLRYGEPIQFGVHDTRPERDKALDAAIEQLTAAISELTRPSGA